MNIVRLHKGQKVRIVENFTNHPFEIGDIVTVEGPSLTDNGWFCRKGIFGKSHPLYRTELTVNINTTKPKNMKGLFSLLIIFLTILLSMTCILPLEVYIIRDIAHLYKVTWVTGLSKEVIFGSLLLFNIVKSSIKDKDIFEEDDNEELSAGLKSAIRLLTITVVLLMSWWFAYIIHALNGL